MYVSFVNFKPAVYLTRIYSLICFAIKYEYMGYTNDSIMLSVTFTERTFYRTHVHFQSVRSEANFNGSNHDISYADTRVGDYVR